MSTVAEPPALFKALFKERKTQHAETIFFHYHFFDPNIVVCCGGNVHKILPRGNGDHVVTTGNDDNIEQQRFVPYLVAHARDLIRAVGERFFVFCYDQYGIQRVAPYRDTRVEVVGFPLDPVEVPLEKYPCSRIPIGISRT